MSSFFTTPASQKKRKLAPSSSSHPASKRRSTIKPPRNSNARPTKPPPRTRDDDSISGSGSNDEVPPASPSIEEDPSSSDSETAAETRLRLASQYLSNLKSTLPTDPTAFDAADIDRDLIAERLQEDVAETKGKLHKRIASHFDFGAATMTNFRNGGGNRTLTGVAVHEPFAYTASKDGWLVKWRLPDPLPPPIPIGKKKQKKLLRQQQQEKQEKHPDSMDTSPHPSKHSPKPSRHRPTKLLSTRSQPSTPPNQPPSHHPSSILTLVASPSGQYLATGSSSHTLTIWNSADLTPLQTFTHHRDTITSLSFRPGTNTLYSASADRTIKTWSLDSMGYVETLFGHQDSVLGVCGAGVGGAERCISVGGRDRTARVWKVVEETQLVFRGGGMGGKGDKKRGGEGEVAKSYAEGSIDCVALVDDETFVTGSDNGGISLWSVHKKKPVFTVPLAHGLEEPLKPEEASAEVEPGKGVVPEASPRWITALATVGYSDLVLSGSWDGEVRVWRVGSDKKGLEGLGVLGGGGLKGVVNDISVLERGERGKETLGVVVGVGTEWRLGRWKQVSDARSRAILFEVPRVAEQMKATKAERRDDSE